MRRKCLDFVNIQHGHPTLFAPDCDLHLSLAPQWWVAQAWGVLVAQLITWFLSFKAEHSWSRDVGWEGWNWEGRPLSPGLDKPIWHSPPLKSPIMALEARLCCAGWEMSSIALPDTNSCRLNQQSRGWSLRCEILYWWNENLPWTLDLSTYLTVDLGTATLDTFSSPDYQSESMNYYTCHCSSTWSMWGLSECVCWTWYVSLRKFNSRQY